MAPGGRLVGEFAFLPGQAGQALLGGFRQKVLHRSEQRRDVYRLLQERPRAGAEGSEELIRARGGDDDGNERMHAGELLKGIPTVLDRHVQVEQREVNRQPASEIKRLLSVLAWNYGAASGHARDAHGLAHRGVAIHSSYAIWAHRLRLR